jgi:hypothetical protein
VFRITIDTRALHAAPADIRALQRAYLALVFTALRVATLAKIDRIAINTPRSLVEQEPGGGVHYHLQDRWSLGENAEGVSIENPAAYAGFVAKEPADAYGSRVEAYHNRVLRAELDTIPEDVRAGMVAELARTPIRL